MSIKSGWIPWNERNDLEDYVLAGFVLDSNREVIRPYLLMVGKIPANKDETILNEIQKSIIKPGHEDRMEFYLSPFLRLSESLQRGVFNPMFEFPKEYQTIFKGIVSSYENKEKFDYDSSVLQSAPVADAPAAPAVSKTPADKTAKPEGQKATEEDIQNAIAELQRYFRSNRTDYMQKTIKKHLEDKLGIVFDLSPRTRLGKFYAVLYYEKTGVLPRNWKKTKFDEAKKELEKRLAGKDFK